MPTYGEIIGQRIAARRQDLNLSQQELAVLANFNQSTVSHIENGRAAQPETYRRLAKSLDVDYQQLVSLDASSPAPEADPALVPKPSSAPATAPAPAVTKVAPLRRAWECPRCSVVNAPWLDQCDCEPQTTGRLK